MAGETRVPKGPVETVLLDAGGVLLDLDYAYLRRLLDARHVIVSAEVLSVAEAIARTETNRRLQDAGSTAEAWRDSFRILFSRSGVPAALHQELIDTLWEAHERVGLWTVPIQDAVETVARLKQLGFRLGVVSNAEGRVERDLNLAGFEGLLETVVDSRLVGVAKPDPRIFRIALERLATGPETAVYVGDVPAIDVVGASAAGIRPILLDRHGLYPEAGVARLRSIGELPAWLEGISVA